MNSPTGAHLLTPASGPGHHDVLGRRIELSGRGGIGGVTRLLQF